jgi:hypothetical protein
MTNNKKDNLKVMMNWMADIHSEIENGVIDDRSGELMSGEDYLMDEGFLRIERPTYLDGDLFSVEIVFNISDGIKTYVKLFRSRQGYVFGEDSFNNHVQLKILKDPMNVFQSAVDLYSTYSV